MVFKPVTDRTRWEGLALCFWLIVLDGLLLLWAVRRPVDAIKFVLIVLFLLTLPMLLQVIYRTWSAFTLEYWLDRNAIRVRWANRRHVMPLHRVQRVIEGAQDLGQPQALQWPLPHLRPTRALGVLNLTMLSTRPLAECLLVDMGDAVYAISPAEPRKFLDAMQTRFRMGTALQLETTPVQTSLWGGWLRSRRTEALLIGGGLLGVLLLFGVLMVSFPQLPDTLSLFFDSAGEPTASGSKNRLFLLPIIGLLTWVVNGAWGTWMARRHHETGAYMLWSGAIVVQTFSLLALISLLP